MADVVSDQELDEFGKYLDELEEEGEEVAAAVADAEAEAEEAEEKEAKQRKTKEAKEYVTKDEYEVSKLDDKFEKDASDEEKELLAIYRRGDENPAQLKKLMQLVRTKVQEAHKKDEPAEEEVEEAAAAIAAERYGAGPISTKRQKVDEEQELIDSIKKGGPNMDRLVAEALFADDPVIGPFLRQ